MGYFETYRWLLTVHVGFAFLGLVTFWLPLVVQKGSRTHVSCGRVFVGCAALALATAFVVAGWRFIDPLGTTPAEEQPVVERTATFARSVRLLSAALAAMALYTFIPLVLAVRVVRTRHRPEFLPGSGVRPLLWAQFGVGLALTGYGVVRWIQNPGTTVYGVALGVGLAGLGSAWWDHRFIAKTRTDSMVWWYKHMECMLRIGIAFHSVFAAFVLTPWLGRLGWGSWALVPYALPAAVGLPAVWFWIRHYRRKFAARSPGA